MTCREQNKHYLSKIHICMKEKGSIKKQPTSAMIYGDDYQIQSFVSFVIFPYSLSTETMHDKNRGIKNNRRKIPRQLRRKKNGKKIFCSQAFYSILCNKKVSRQQQSVEKAYFGRYLAYFTFYILCCVKIIDSSKLNFSTRATNLQIVARKIFKPPIK